MYMTRCYRTRARSSHAQASHETRTTRQRSENMHTNHDIMVHQVVLYRSYQTCLNNNLLGEHLNQLLPWTESKYCRWNCCYTEGSVGQISHRCNGTMFPVPPRHFLRAGPVKGPLGGSSRMSRQQTTVVEGEGAEGAEGIVEASTYFPTCIRYHRL